MNASLIEKIKSLITEARRFSRSDSAAINSAGLTGGSFGVRGAESRESEQETLDAARRARLRDARLRFEQSVRASFRKLGGRNGAVERLIYSYNGADDIRDWQPTISPFKSEKFGDTTFWVTTQTKEFLSRLMDLLTRQEVSDDDDSVVVNTIKDLKVETKVITRDSNEKLEDMKTVFDELEIEDQNQIRRLYNLLMTEDKRFNRPSYSIKISAPIERYSPKTIKEIQDNLTQMNSEFESRLGIDEVVANINNSRINVEIKITADTTLLPLYNKVGYIPLSSKVGALDKMAWSYQKMQEFNKVSYFNVLKSKEKLLAKIKTRKRAAERAGRNTDRIDAELAEAQNDVDQLNEVINRYNTTTEFNEDATNDVMSIGPLALLAKAKSLINKNAAIAITSVDGMCYFYYPSTDDSGRHVEKLIKFNSAKPYGNALKNYFEGIITKQEYDAVYESLDESKKAAAEPIHRFLKGYYTANIYCLKLMFCDWVNLQYKMKLPTTGAESSIGGDGSIQFKMPDSISVPGAQKLSKSETAVKKIIDPSLSSANNYLVTTAENVLHKGTGSMSFLQGIHHTLLNNYKIGSNYTDITLLITIMNSILGGFYAIVDRTQFDKLKNNETAMSADSTSLNVAEHSELADFLMALRRPRPNDYQLVPKFDKDNYEELTDCLEYFTKMCSQLVTRMSGVVGPSSKSMKKRMKSAINFANATVAGFPTLIKKIDDGIVEGINDSDNHQRTLSNCIIDLNRVQDLGPMVTSYFIALTKQINAAKAAPAKKTKSKENDKELFEPEMIPAYDYAGLNLTQSAKGYGKVARTVFVKQLCKFFFSAKDDFVARYMRSVKNRNSEEVDEEEKELTGSKITILEFLVYIFDTAKTLQKIIGIDGIRILEYAGMENLDKPRNSWLSRINSELTLEAFAKPPANPDEMTGKEWKERLPFAIAETARTTLSTGLAVDKFCQENLQPIVRIVRAALGKVERATKVPALITNKNSQLPYVPVHTAMFVTVNRDGSVVLNLVSSCLTMTPDRSNYNYEYDLEDNTVVVPSNERPRPEDATSVYHEMAKRDMAYCFIMSSSQRYMMLNIIRSLESVFKNAESAYAQLKDLVNGSPEILDALSTDNVDLGTNRLLDIDIPGQNVESLVSNILKYIMIRYILNFDMEED